MIKIFLKYLFNIYIKLIYIKLNYIHKIHTEMHRYIQHTYIHIHTDYLMYNIQGQNDNNNILTARYLCIHVHILLRLKIA